MFSTRVILKNRDEYILFIEALIDRGEKDLALQFLDSSGGSFPKDQDIYALYHKIKEN